MLPNEPLPAGYSGLFYLIHTHVSISISNACQLPPNSARQRLGGKRAPRGAHVAGKKQKKKNREKAKVNQGGMETSEEDVQVTPSCRGGGYCDSRKGCWGWKLGVRGKISEQGNAGIPKGAGLGK